LIEHNYKQIDNDSDRIDFTSLIDTEWLNVVRFVSDSIKSEELTKAMLIRFDFLNLKILIKDTLRREKFKDEEDVEDLKLFHVATFPIEELQDNYWEGNYDRFPDHLKDSISIFQNIEELEPSAVDIILDKLMYKELVDFAIKAKNDFLLKYYKNLIDVKNILNLFRLKNLGKEYKDYQNILMDSGNLDITTLSKLYSENMEMIVSRLQFVDYYNEIKTGYEYYAEHNSLSEMERLFDNRLIEYLKTAKMVSFGPEALIGYYFAKENELKNLRIVLTGIENKLEKEMITERLRENYV
jgi:V/A-type H+-transporting ATPase subunit C